MDTKCLLSRTKEIKMPQEMKKRIVENVLRWSNGTSDEAQDSGGTVNMKREKD